MGPARDGPGSQLRQKRLTESPSGQKKCQKQKKQRTVVWKGNLTLNSRRQRRKRRKGKDWKRPAVECGGHQAAVWEAGSSPPSAAARLVTWMILVFGRQPPGHPQAAPPVCALVPHLTVIVIALPVYSRQLRKQAPPRACGWCWALGSSSSPLDTGEFCPQRVLKVEALEAQDE